jgi:CRP-like cAMP-binding protein
MSESSVNDTLPRRIAVLRNIPLFSDLSDQDLARLVNDWRLRKYDKDEIIFRQGDDSHEMYVVLEGKVRIFRTTPAGDETSISIFSDNNLIGEFAAIDDRSRSATAKAILPSALLTMTRDRFLYHVQSIPNLAIALIKILADKLRWTTIYAETIAQYDAAGRLLHILLLYNDQFGETLEPGKKYELDLSLNQTDLASLVGARREWVNRLLRDWQKRGLIEYNAGKIILLDLPRIKAERDGRIEANQGGW